MRRGISFLTAIAGLTGAAATMFTAVGVGDESATPSSGAATRKRASLVADWDMARAKGKVAVTAAAKAEESSCDAAS
jgi:hypothetical protein